MLDETKNEHYVNEGLRFVKQNIKYTNSKLEVFPWQKEFQIYNDLRIILTNGTWTLLNLQRCVDTMSASNEDSCGTLTEEHPTRYFDTRIKTYCHRLLVCARPKHAINHRVLEVPIPHKQYPVIVVRVQRCIVTFLYSGYYWFLTVAGDGILAMLSSLKNVSTCVLYKWKNRYSLDGVSLPSETTENRKML